MYRSDRFLGLAITVSHKSTRRLTDRGQRRSLASHSKAMSDPAKNLRFAFLLWNVEKKLGSVAGNLGACHVDPPNWQADAACRDLPVDWFFPEQGPNAWHDLRQAVAVCQECPVIRTVSTMRSPLSATSPGYLGRHFGESATSNAHL
jgi:hypothetical protein